MKLLSLMYLVLLLFFGIALGTVSASTQPVLFFNPDIVESNTGDDDSVLLMMDGAYRGLSGYGVIISLESKDIAEITAVEAPVWAKVQDIRKINSTAYIVQGTDIDNKQGPGSIQIALASLKIHAKSPGYAYLYVNPIAIDDDQKGRYIPFLQTGSIIITGAGSEPVIPMNR